MRRLLIAVAAVIATGSAADAQTVSLPGSFYVDGTSPTGTSFAFTNLSTNSALNFSVTGTPTLQSYPNVYGTNAAGIVTVAGTTGVGGYSTDPNSGFTFGSLIISLNGSAKQVFAPSVANGSGSSSPPMTLAYSDTLADLFGLSAGTTLPAATLKFVVDDNLYTDNTGGFTVNAVTGAVTEPAVWSMLIIGFGIVGYALRRTRNIASRVSFAWL